MNFDHIKEPMTLEQIKAAYDSHDYSAELLLQHLLKCAVADSDDAARYRWLRDVGDESFRPFCERTGYTAKQCDSAIDAARSTT